MPRAHGRHGRPGARVRRSARSLRQRRSPPAGRLALARGRAVLRGDPRQPDGAGEPPQVPLDPWPGQRLLGRGVRRGRLRRPRRSPRRPVRVHRQPGQQPVATDARRPRDHPGRPGRDHPRGVSWRARRRRRAGHRQDRGRSAPDRLPPLLRPTPRSPPGWCPLRRSAPALPGLRRRRTAQPRRGGRADLHGAGPGPRGRCGRDRSRPGGGSAQVVCGHGAGHRAGRRSLRGAAHRRHGGRDTLGRHLAERQRLGRGVRGAGARHPAQRGARPDLGRAAHDPRRQARGRRLGGAGPRVAGAQPGPVLHPRPRLAADRRDRRGGRPVGRAGLPAPVRPLARARPGQVAAARGPAGVDAVRPAAPGRGPAAARRPGGVPAQAPPGGRRRGRTRGDGRGRRPPDRERRLRDEGDVDAPRLGRRRA